MFLKPESRVSPIGAIFKGMLHMDISFKYARTKSTLFIAVFTVSRTGVKSFSAKSQIVNVLGSVGHTVSVTTIQCCHCSRNAPGDNT